MSLARLEHPKDGRADLVLAQPERRNATSIGLLEEAIRLIQGVGSDRSVLVIRGEGPHFCAGIDLDEVLESSDTCFRLLRLLSQLMREVRRVPAITIAPVQGAAIGGGFGLLCACDFAIGTPNTKVGYPPIELGLSPALMTPWLVQKIGPSAARAFMLRGGTTTGTEAARLGLLTDLVAEEELSESTDRLADQLLSADPTALRTTKRYLNHFEGSDQDVILDHAADVSATLMSRDATQRRVSSFRQPSNPH